LRLSHILQLAFYVLFLVNTSFAYANTFTDIKEQYENTEKTPQEKQSLLANELENLTIYSLEEQAKYWQYVGKNEATLLNQAASIAAFTKAIDIRISNEFLLSEELVADLINRSHSKHNLTPGVKAECPDVDLAVHFAKKLNDPKVIPGVLSVWAKCLYIENESIAKPIKVLNEALILAQKSHLPPSEQATIYSQTSFMYLKAYLFKDAYKSTLRAYEIWKEDRNDLGEYFMLDLLISTAIKMGNYTLAEQHINDLREFKSTHPEHVSVGFVISYRSADLAKHQGKIKTSIFEYEQALKKQNNMKGIAYVKAAYEKLIYAYFRDEQIQKSRNLLKEFETKFPDSHIRLPETAAISLFYDKKFQYAFNEVFLLIENEKQRRKLFIEDSIIQSRQNHNDNLKQLNNVLLEQQLTYSITIGFLIIIILIIFMLYQHKKRLLLKKEKSLSIQLLNNKNKLLADVSHELRTPLTVLQIEVETLQHDFSDDIEASYNALRKKINDMNYLIDDISLLAKSDTGTLNFNYSEVNIKSFVCEMESELSRFIISKGFDYKNEISIPSLVDIKIDEVKLKQALLNIVNNSIMYTDIPGVIKFSSFIKNTYLIIRISDSAPTVNTKQLDLIFERLFRVDSSRSRSTGGSGFGLAICKTIIESQNGFISADQSRLGGVSIEIKLPLG